MNKNKSQIFPTNLNFHDHYPCPVCRVGRISTMPLMEAMSCDFCQEIFTVNLESQEIKMPSRQPPLIWRWNGWRWSQGKLEGVELGRGYILAAIAFVLFPTGLIGMGAYYFSPHPDVPLYWIPYLWTLLTFMSHLAIMIWIFIEVYQIPLRAYWRGITQHRN
ncbi:MAG: hypothetical protein F6K62_14350 [Sphaerospermopsis sp. SIO1G2]|nr:hypothetical protein [Sphaerospermopsis sp. SIO1G1]NET72064.1 hypothetical protein [Sphaerospermopsis sp. SIO1G2]